LVEFSGVNQISGFLERSLKAGICAGVSIFQLFDVNPLGVVSLFQLFPDYTII
jgi:hypothetical protein